MPNKQFHLCALAAKKGKRRGEVKVYSGISTWKWDENDPTVTSNDFDKQLQALGDVDEITVRINSPGGVVTEAVAIRTALMKHKAKKTIEIEGCCDSAATLIACMPGAKVRMAKGGEYMIHCCSAMGWGQKDKILSLYRSMEQTDSDMADIYAERTGMTREECLRLMEAETWYGAEGAKEAGFVDEIITSAEDAEIAACAVDADAWELMRSCYAHAPERALTRAAIGASEDPSPEGAKEVQEGVERPENCPVDSFQRDESGQRHDRKALLHSEDPTPTETPVNGEAAKDSKGRPQSPLAAPAGAEPKVSNETSAVAAGSSTENTPKKGVGAMNENSATAEAMNPEMDAQAIARQAVEAERERVRDINALTRPGEKWQAMARKAIDEGTSAADYLKEIIAEERKQGEEYLEARRRELEPAARVGAGDTSDNDDKDIEAKTDKAAKDIAEMAKSMSADGLEMA